MFNDFFYEIPAAVRLPDFGHTTKLPGLCFVLILLSGLVSIPRTSYAQGGTIDVFSINNGDHVLSRIAQPNTYFDKTGRKFALIGFESGRLEAWAYPLKLFRDFKFSFFVGSSTEPILAAEIVQRITVQPAVTTLTYTFQSFTVQAHYITPVEEPGAMILLEVNSTEPLTIVSSFLPVLQPMWPAGMGGQYAYWDDNVKAYLISESSGENHAYVGSPAASGMSYTPAHMLSDQPNQFKIVIDDPINYRHKYIPILMAGGNGSREAIQTAYLRLSGDPQHYFQKTAAHYKDLIEHTLQVQTPEERLNDAFTWAKISYDNLVIDNPDLPGRGLVAGLGPSGSGGRPGFGWFFGGDTYINSLSLNAIGAYGTVRDALSFMRQFQRDDGKMVHEVTQAVDYIDWFGDYSYAYIHADTSPYYIVAAFIIFG